ncbi:hypothetical protein PR001_g24307 [Phytophthora rubi]|uniref:Uncharacterized protein n=1 Tax=Phytophthora rubi TaxID=129364 RepID=A0A6A3J0U4_9STRA|nr:hypothetical protein PR001_g24307 [Phytophthora rubi]KAE8988020.1 hypothetical protein PR002_g21889 [Phytophthora rubi]
MADQSAEDFKSTVMLLQTVQNLCRAGEVRKLADAMASIESQALESKPKKPQQEDSRQEETKSAQKEGMVCKEGMVVAATPEIKQE